MSDLTEVKAVATHTRRAGRPSAREAGLKHEALLEAALEEFSRAGFHGASVRAIAEKAGLSTRTLYNHYADKVALFAACLEMSSLQIQFLIGDNGGTLHEQLVRFARRMQTQLGLTRNVQLARVIFRECNAFPKLRDVAKAQFHRFQVLPVQKLLQEHGFAEARAEILATAYVAMVFQKWQTRVIYDEPVMTRKEIEAHAETTTDLFLKGACSD